MATNGEIIGQKALNKVEKKELPPDLISGLKKAVDNFYKQQKERGGYSTAEQMLDLQKTLYKSIVIAIPSLKPNDTLFTIAKKANEYFMKHDIYFDIKIRSISRDGNQLSSDVVINVFMNPIRTRQGISIKQAYEQFEQVTGKRLNLDPNTKKFQMIKLGTAKIADFNQYNNDGHHSGLLMNDTIVLFLHNLIDEKNEIGKYGVDISVAELEQNLKQHEMAHLLFLAIMPNINSRKNLYELAEAHAFSVELFDESGSKMRSKEAVLATLITLFKNTIGGIICEGHFRCGNEPTAICGFKLVVLKLGQLPRAIHCFCRHKQGRRNFRKAFCAQCIQHKTA